MKRVLLIAAFIFLNAAGAPRAVANPIGKFFRRLGDSISGAKREPTPHRATRKSRKTSAKPGVTPPPAAQSSPDIVNPPYSPTPQPVPVASAGSVLSRGPRQDFPYGIPVPNKHGFVTSPYAPKEGFVDVRGFASGTEVKDPFTGKIFLTP